MSESKKYNPTFVVDSRATAEDVQRAIRAVIGEHRYPSTAEIAADVNNETVAITVAVGAMADALERCPLPDSLKVYAAIELAFKYGERRYVKEVFREITLLMGGPDE